MRIVISVLVLTALCGPLLGEGVVPAYAKSEFIVFDDDNLAALVRETLGLEEGAPIPRNLAETIEELVSVDPPSAKRIAELGGIEALVNLKVLNLQENRNVEDLEPLRNLTGLTSLNLRRNNVSDIEPISGLTNLRQLNLRRNKVSDIEPISGLTNLRQLNLRDNNITDISHLVNLVKLEDLNLGQNAGIADYSVLQNFPLLDELGLRANGIDAIDGITSPDWHPLMEDLDLSENNISDISILAGYKKLVERLFLDGNPIVCYCPVASYYERIEDTDFPPYPDFPLDVPKVNFSHDAGFYNRAFDLALECTKPELEIYYTLDGSEPVRGSANTFLYTTPIIIEKMRKKPGNISMIDETSPSWAPPMDDIFFATVVRARAYCGDEPWPSAMSTNTYFVDDNMRNRHDLPIISIATDEESLFDYISGIYVKGKIYYDNLDESRPWWGRPANYTQRGADWERPVNIEFFEPDGTMGFSLGAGARIHGGATRAYRQKSLRIYARSEYDKTKEIDYELFPGHKKSGSDEELATFKRIILRNSGNDWNRTMLRDALMQSLLDDLDLETQTYRPCVVYINGEYWGIHNIRERYDDWYLANNYDVNRRDVAILSGNGTIEEGNEADRNHYRDMLDYIRKNDITKPDHYNHVQTLMDIDNFIDYYAAQIYFANHDWPHNNVRFWKYRTDGFIPDAPKGLDGRWRWMVYDTDFGFGLYPACNYDANSLNRVLNTGEGYPSDWSTFLFRSLIENEHFKENFVNRMLHLLETVFLPETVTEKIDDMQKNIENEITEHLFRWSLHGGSIDSWRFSVERLREFAMKRPAYIICHLNKEFDLDIPNCKYTVTAKSGAGGSISPSGKIEVTHCDDATFEISPDMGYSIASVIVDGEDKGAVEEYTFENVVQDHTIEARFRQDHQETCLLYFAEGYTREDFNTWLCLLNPHNEEVVATITFMFSEGQTQTLETVIPSASRQTINVNDHVGADREVSAKIETDKPVVAERPMYFNYSDKWSGGHIALGTTTLSENWYFAEGYTGSGFDEWICILNPSEMKADITFHFQTQEEGEIVKPGFSIEPKTRATFKVNDVLGPDYQTSLKLESSVPVVAERPMYFNYTGRDDNNWSGGHCVMGHTGINNEYFFAEGYTGEGFDMWLTMQNPNDYSIDISASYHFDSEEDFPMEKTYTVEAGQRQTVFVRDEIGKRNVSVYLRSESDFLAERPMYFKYKDMWPGGHCVIGAPSSSKEWLLAEGYTGNGFEQWLCIQNPENTDAEVEITYYTEETGELNSRTLLIPAKTRHTVSVNDDIGSGYQVSTKIIVRSSSGIVVERPMYFDYKGWTGGHAEMGYRADTI